MHRPQQCRMAAEAKLGRWFELNRLALKLHQHPARAALLKSYLSRHRANIRIAARLAAAHARRPRARPRALRGA